MHLTQRLLLLLAFLFASSGVMAAAAPDAVLGNKWAGTYTPHQETDSDFFQITIDEVRTEGARLIAIGRGRFFDEGYIADVRIEWVIDTETLFIDMWDSDPAGDNEDYNASGSYQGSISRDLDTIFAIWRSSDRNLSGTLKLNSVDEFPDYESKQRPIAKP